MIKSLAKLNTDQHTSLKWHAMRIVDNLRLTDGLKLIEHRRALNHCVDTQWFKASFPRGLFRGTIWLTLFIICLPSYDSIPNHTAHLYYLLVFALSTVRLHKSFLPWRCNFWNKFPVALLPERSCIFFKKITTFLVKNCLAV